MKKFIALGLSAAMMLSLAACGDSAAGTASADTAASGTETEAAESSTEAAAETTASADSLNVCLASEPASLDPALNTTVDGGTLCLHLFSGLASWRQAEDGSMELVPTCAEELPEGVVNDDGTVTYTYTLRDGLKWSDGKPLTAGDFVFAWNRAASTALAADYGYMFEAVKGYADIWETDADENYVNPDAKLAVEAPDDKTLVVTLNNAIPYWNELLAFPAYLPVREDVVSNEAWATDPSTYVGNGAYVMSGWEHNSVITLKKNDQYVDAAEVTMPEINFYLSDNSNNMLTNFQNGDWQMIDDVPTNEIAALKEQYPEEFKVTGQLGTYYACWNVNQEILPKGSSLTGVEAERAREEIRRAISLLFDRNYIVTNITQAGQVPASSFVAMGLTDADGSEFYQNAGPSDAYNGYYDVSADALESNYNEAIETLKKYYEFDEAKQQFTNVPSLIYLYNTSEGHKAIGEYLQSALAGIGITMNLENQEWNTFIATRKAGDFTLARNGWLGDYNDPISFLDMWVTVSGNNDVQLGKGAHKDLKAYSLDLTDLGYDLKVTDGTWAETYDVLITDIKTCTDKETRYELMHRAEDLLMSTGTICPLYYYTDLFMVDPNLKGFFTSPLGFKYFTYSHF
ncbi:peptide ABC transporter substrate-binding protein [Lachnoclostridium sp. Marseille-P6806]|uniref:peptide ABC transporter substrate-binding protein n=1 Tax=Lachnoclostridium sp. Marseille-P6806 TaxID=2364793 RepID=UPI0010322141|nr:peptide ABC transporter substrate-binding protein [Lachnoclostridium sp. Marseille-P6806]